MNRTFRHECHVIIKLLNDFIIAQYFEDKILNMEIAKKKIDSTMVEFKALLTNLNQPINRM